MGPYIAKLIAFTFVFFMIALFGFALSTAAVAIFHHFGIILKILALALVCGSLFALMKI